MILQSLKKPPNAMVRPLNSQYISKSTCSITLDDVEAALGTSFESVLAKALPVAEGLVLNSDDGVQRSIKAILVEALVEGVSDVRRLIEAILAEVRRVAGVLDLLDDLSSAILFEILIGVLDDNTVFFEPVLLVVVPRKL